MKQVKCQDCPCSVEFTPAMGTYDTVTNEWLPDVPTEHVRLIVDPSCERHNLSSLIQRFPGARMMLDSQEQFVTKHNLRGSAKDVLSYIGQAEEVIDQKRGRASCSPSPANIAPKL